MDIDRQYADLRLGLVDASIVALAEELGVHRLATRDVRHFSAVRRSRELALLRQARAPAGAEQRERWAKA